MTPSDPPPPPPESTPELPRDLPPLDLGNARAVAASFYKAAAAFRRDPLRRGNSVHLPDHGHLTVTGDLHDNQLNFRRILKLAALDQPSLSDPFGTAGGGRHLILHEVIHGPDRLNDADLSIRMLARCADLKLRYPRQVHVLLSNHELAQLRGETITKDGVSVVEAFDEGMEYLYGNDYDLVRDAAHDYLSALPLAVRGANGLMVSHSLPAPRRIEAFDPDILDRETTEADLMPYGSVYDLVWGRYHNEKITEELAARWNVKAFIVGHQPAEMGFAPVARNTLILASDHSHGSAVCVDLARSYTRDELIDVVRPLNSVMV